MSLQLVCTLTYTYTLFERFGKTKKNSGMYTKIKVTVFTKSTQLHKKNIKN